ncbi:hypothetical protein CRG98_002593 [Punica granatum]|nr:hypothetical protein CRG98_002593 [Punica granatum]
MAVFGEVRAVQMERLAHEGTVTVHFYDLRHARRALREIREQHMQQQCRVRDHYGGTIVGGLPHPPSAHGLVAGRAVWAQFIIAAANSIPDGQNQGTIVIFNLDPDVSPDSLRHTFEAFGPVKELRDTPYKKHQRFVEFYDVRDAAKALREMNGKDIHGKNVIIEFSRPGGYSRKFLNSGGSCMTVSKTPTQPPLPPQAQPMLPHPMIFPQTVVHQLPQANEVPIEASMCRLSLGFEGGNDSNYNEESEVGSKRQLLGPVFKKSGSGKKKHGKVVSDAKQQQSRGSKPWKSRQGRKLDSRFVISDDAIGESGNSGDSRTTVMIKNIPNKYSQKLLLNMLDNHCINCNEQIGDEDSPEQPFSSYDFVYLPIDFNNKCNVGYGFVNMTSPQAAWRLYKAFHLRHWEVFNSRKICEVTYARIQGLEALKEHFKNSKFPCEMDHYLPVVFSPPRDGRLLTDPQPVVGQSSLSKQLLQPLPVEARNNDEMDSQDGLENDHGNDHDDHGRLLVGSSNGGDSGDGDDVKDGGSEVMRFS